MNARVERIAAVIADHSWYLGRNGKGRCECHWFDETGRPQEITYGQWRIHLAHMIAETDELIAVRDHIGAQQVLAELLETRYGTTVTWAGHIIDGLAAAGYAVVAEQLSEGESSCTCPPGAVQHTGDSEEMRPVRPDFDCPLHGWAAVRTRPRQRGTSSR